MIRRPLYLAIGRGARPLSDGELATAIEEWIRDHAGDIEPGDPHGIVRAQAARLRQLNDQNRARAEAEAARAAEEAEAEAARAAVNEGSIGTPWHYVILPTESSNPLVARLRTTNPATLRAFEQHQTSWQEAIAALVKDGASADEILAGDWLALVPSIRLRHYLEDLIQRETDDIRVRYQRARAAVQAEGKRPTDRLVAEKLDKNERTLRRWRHDGLIE